MRNVAMVVAYDGTNYHGWQTQPGLKTVENVLKDAIEKVVNHPVKLIAAARTDAGVHAIGQVVNFRTESEIPLENLHRGINTFLPYDIRVTSLSEVDIRFNAKSHAKSKTYVYVICNDRTPLPFFFRYSWHVPYFLDVSFMDLLSKHLIGKKDFASFKKKDEVYRSTEREILKAKVKKVGRFIYFVCEGTGFMRYMVRIIVGTLLLGGMGKISEDDFVKIIESKNRDLAGPTAPAKGLFLKKVSYEKYNFTSKPRL